MIVETWIDLLSAIGACCTRFLVSALARRGALELQSDLERTLGCVKVEQSREVLLASIKISVRASVSELDSRSKQACGRDFQRWKKKKKNSSFIRKNGIV
jgi:hypothetical protein